MIQLQNLSHGYAGKFLYENLSFTFSKNQKYALVGANGTGKTTIFKLITGEESPIKGNLVVPKAIKVQYLAQELVLQENMRVIDIALSGFQEIYLLEKQLEAINLLLADHLQSQFLEKNLAQHQTITEQLELAGAYTIEAEAKKILSGLGFKDEDFLKPIQTFSGGWRMRAQLAKMLLQKPDYLLLDEPTNHLDIESLQWLENYLAKYEESVIIISHDRLFLDKIVTKTIDLANNTLTEYSGNFSFYEEEKERIEILAEKNKEKQDAQIQHVMAFVERFRYKSSKAKQVQSRVKLLEKIQQEFIPVKRKAINFSFNVATASGKSVFSIKELKKTYDRTIFSNVNLEIFRHDKIAILGPNGAGKSTFIKLLMGKEKPTDGQIVNGHNVKIGYYSQHQLDELNASNTIYEEVLQAAAEEKRLSVRDILGAFLFSGDDITKKIAVLSGGEKARVALAKLLASPSNTLILDEPTNHLDMPSKDKLQEALIEFNGTLILISHDRYFLDGLSNRVLYFKNGSIKDFIGEFGDFDMQAAYANRNVEVKNIETIKNFEELKKNKNIISKVEKEIKELENKTAVLENEKVELEKKMMLNNSVDELQKLNENLVHLTKEISLTLAKWEEKSLILEKLNFT